MLDTISKWPPKSSFQFSNNIYRWNHVFVFSTICYFHSYLLFAELLSISHQKKNKSFECVCMGKILTMCTFEWLLTDNNIQLTLSFRLLHNFSSQHFSWENSFILKLFIGLEWNCNEIYRGLLNWEWNKYI